MLHLPAAGMKLSTMVVVSTHRQKLKNPQLTLWTFIAVACLLRASRADCAPLSINTVPHSQVAVPNGTRYCSERFDTTVQRAMSGHSTDKTTKSKFLLNILI